MLGRYTFSRKKKPKLRSFAKPLFSVFGRAPQEERKMEATLDYILCQGIGAQVNAFLPCQDTRHTYSESGRGAEIVITTPAMMLRPATLLFFLSSLPNLRFADFPFKPFFFFFLSAGIK